MIRLIIPLRLSKAGKQGLIPVQKQVTKKGKTFTQTFYVKPDSTPKEPSAPSPIDLPANISSTHKYSEPHYNRNDGFYVAWKDEKIYRIPDKYISGVEEYKGHRFVVGRKLWRDNNNEIRIESEFAVWEQSSGLGVSEFDGAISAEEAWSKVKGRLDAKEDGYLDAAVAKARKVDEYFKLEENIVRDTDDVFAAPVVRVATPEDRIATAEAIFKRVYPEDVPVHPEDILGWMSTNYSTYTTRELNEVFDEVNDSFVLEHAIERNVVYSDAYDQIEAINSIVQEAGDSEMFYGNSIDFDQVLSWIDNTSDDDFTSGVNVDKYGASDDYTGDSWSSADVIAYAIEHGLTFDEAQESAEQALEDQREDLMDEDNSIDFLSTSSTPWYTQDIRNLGAWVRGDVKENKDDAKAMFDRRERGDSSAEGNAIVNTVETHLTPIDHELWRGTKNSTWAELADGDIVPFGMASFSSSKSVAVGFSDEVVLVLEKAEDNPVMGVDINQVTDDGRDEGHERSLDYHGVPDYYVEKEVIVMAPMLKVLRKEVEPTSWGGKRVWLHVQPVRMDMVDMQKSKHTHDELVALAEKTFDYPLHREPADAFADDFADIE